MNVAADFANAQRTVIAKGRYYAEHDAPMAQLVDRFTLRKGERDIVVNRYTSMSAAALTDGVDIEDDEDLEFDTVTLASSEYGLRVILTDKMVRQHNDDAMGVVGKLLGQAMARYRDEQLLALFAGLTTLTTGAAGQAITLQDVGKCNAALKNVPVNGPYYAVFHPWTIEMMWEDLLQHGGTNFTALQGTSTAEKLVKDYMVARAPISKIPIISDGNLTPDGSDDVVSGVFAPEAFALVTQKEWSTERQRDASLRGTELVCVADEGFYELVDTYAVQCTFDAESQL